MLRKMLTLGLGPFLDPERRRLLLLWAFLRSEPVETSCLINEDGDYIVFGRYRIRV